MKFNLKDVSPIEGLKPVDPADLADYERAMREEVIPALLEQKKRKYFGPQETGWMCPNCGKAHPPSVTTCPHDNRTLGERLRAIN